MGKFWNIVVETFDKHFAVCTIGFECLLILLIVLCVPGRIIFGIIVISVFIVFPVGWLICVIEVIHQYRERY